ncbi:O-antigen ligase family protein [Ruminiclostridium herbifermentans]|uniref:O-antigen ligase family protein n=1 Tax=Ruminiclostridium herbifermentans TaxID=2488810 RepID=A0A4U7JK51_9FIRM|nr:O-antigen ligase family protein [Ruminiclostridium herbifermentans]QNU66624.1 O-antigen ligase family protein [Ruminiclostridium herbifermentans]
MKSNISFNNIILIVIFLSPFSNILVYKTNIADFRLIQVLWLMVFCVFMIKKAENKELLISSPNRLSLNKGSKLTFILYIFAISISGLLSVNTNRSIKELIQYIYLFILMYSIYCKAKDHDFMNKIINSIICSNVFLVTICVVSYITGKVIIPSFTILSNGMIYVNNNLFSTNTLMESGKEIVRLNGILGLNATLIANLILIQSLLVNYMIRQVTGNKRVLLCLLLVANLFTMIVTYSRAGLLIFITLHLISAMSKNHIRNVAILAAAVFVGYMFLSMFPEVKERILETFNTEERSSKYHFAIWLIAIKTGFNNIITGIGLGNMAFSYDDFWYEFSRFGIEKINSVNVHNFILQIWAEQGAIGLIVNSILYFSPILLYIKFKLLYKQKINRTIYEFIFLSYISTLIYNLTNNNFYIEAFWILAGVVYAIKDFHLRTEKIDVVETDLSLAYGKKALIQQK